MLVLASLCPGVFALTFPAQGFTCISPEVYIVVKVPLLRMHGQPRKLSFTLVIAHNCPKGKQHVDNQQSKTQIDEHESTGR